MQIFLVGASKFETLILSNYPFIFRVVIEDAKGVTYNFEMSGGTGDKTKYIAMAIAKESQMADADLYYCDGEGVRTGVIQTRRLPPTYYNMTVYCRRLLNYIT